MLVKKTIKPAFPQQTNALLKRMRDILKAHDTKVKGFKITKEQEKSLDKVTESDLAEMSVLVNMLRKPVDVGFVYGKTDMGELNCGCNALVLIHKTDQEKIIEDIGPMMAAIVEFKLMPREFIIPIEVNTSSWKGEEPTKHELKIFEDEVLKFASRSLGNKVLTFLSKVIENKNSTAQTEEKEAANEV